MERVAQYVAKRLPSHQIDIFGSDSSILNALPYYMFALVIITSTAIHVTTDNAYILLCISYSIIPLLDCMFSLDAKNPDPKQAKNLIERGWEF